MLTSLKIIKNSQIYSIWWPRELNKIQKPKHTLQKESVKRKYNNSHTHTESERESERESESERLARDSHALLELLNITIFSTLERTKLNRTYNKLKIKQSES